MVNKTPKKILVIGSGPIVIGQAAEFDYSGTQACLTLKEKGCKVILINPNPATIMTDKSIVDKVYMEPLSANFVKWVISRERPEALLPTLGGQVALNLAVDLHKSGVLKKYNLEILGTSIEAIIAAEDRLEFKKNMQKIGVPTPPSLAINNISDALAFSNKIGYPVVVRPSYTMGGAGGGFASNDRELTEILEVGLRMSPISECLIEKSIKGYKEIEYEVMRDKKGTTVIVCNMENIDPVGVHTGDSMVVAPSLTLNNTQFQMLRTVSIKIINHFKIQGGCNVQLALDPLTNNFFIIEINPRVSRSSALASKATGYPIAKISALISLGMNLEDIVYNKNNKNITAALEPAIDYVVSKIARFPFDKFKNINNYISTYMQATGEVMSIGRTFEESFLKSIRSIENEFRFVYSDKFNKMSVPRLKKLISSPNGYRIYQIFALLSKKCSVDEIYNLTKIDKYYLNKFLNIQKIKNLLNKNINNYEVLEHAKKYGFSDYEIGKSWKMTEKEIFRLRQSKNILPVYKIIDTCAGEFKSTTPYLYSTYGQENESVISKNKKIIIIGSGPIRIGQGVEFDYSTVQSILSFKKLGYETIIINNNPETVSTDYSVADKLYFEPINYEDVMNIIELEKPDAIVFQFGGQTALNLSKELQNENLNILGTSIKSIDISENRELFSNLAQENDILMPTSATATTIEDAKKIIKEIGYPVMVRPNYVIGGQSMEIISSPEDETYLLDLKNKLKNNFVILIDKYIHGKEIEIDAVSDGKDIFIPGIMEHIETAGIHSGDSTTVYPTISVSNDEISKMTKYVKKICTKMNVIGLMNMQLIIKDNKIYVLEINLRSSRTIPFISKSTDVNVVDIACKVMVGQKLKNFKNINLPINKKRNNLYYIKSPVFSFNKLWKIADPLLGPEMKSTGESIGIDSNFNKALYKSLLSSNIDPLRHHSIIVSSDKTSQPKILEAVKKLDNVGYKIYATRGTSNFLRKNGIKSIMVNKLNKDNNIIDLINTKKISFIINIPSFKMRSRKDLLAMRKLAINKGIAIISSTHLAESIAGLCSDMKYLIKPL